MPTDDHRLTGAGAAAALRDDPRADDVVGVVATAGTTNAGIVDDLAGVADVAAERSLWFHIDGAYGGAAALFAPVGRGTQFAGFERADSFIVDPHKWLFAPFDCAALVYRQPNLAKAVHTQDAQYLEVLHSENPEEWNPSDYAYHLTRRARGLPLWFSMAVNGLDAYRDAVEAGLAIAQRAAERITEAPHVELVRDPGLSIVLFRRPGWDKADYDAWSARLLHDQIGFVTPTTLGGRDGGPLRLLAPQHHRRDGRRDPGLNGLRRLQARRRRITIVSTSCAPGTGQTPPIRKRGTPVTPSSSAAASSARTVVGVGVAREHLLGDVLGEAGRPRPPRAGPGGPRAGGPR